MNAISVVIIAQNEATRLPRAVASCHAFADEVLVIDGGSRDETPGIARALGCHVIEHPFPGYGQQRNFGALRALHDWIFVIDCDEEVDARLAQALVAWKRTDGPTPGGYELVRIGDFLGRWLEGSPERLVRLYDRRRARFTEVRVHETASVAAGGIGRLDGTIRHYGFRSLSDHVQRFNQYTDLEARAAHDAGRRFSLARLFWRPPARFLHRYFVRRTYQAGLPGFLVAALWFYYELLVEAKLFELQRAAQTHPAPTPLSTGRDLPRKLDDQRLVGHIERQ